MKYLCLIYEDGTRWMDVAPADAAAYLAECRAAHDAIAAGVDVLATEALDHTATAATVRVRGGRISTTDGPFAETKEVLGGFYLIDARDLEEAVQAAAKIPSARTGSIEVRPVVDFGGEP